jgi:hypothetical protein
LKKKGGHLQSPAVGDGHQNSPNANSSPSKKKGAQSSIPIVPVTIKQIFGAVNSPPNEDFRIDGKEVHQVWSILIFLKSLMHFVEFLWSKKKQSLMKREIFKLFYINFFLKIFYQLIILFISVLALLLLFYFN